MIILTLNFILIFISTFLIFSFFYIQHSIQTNKLETNQIKCEIEFVLLWISILIKQNYNYFPLGFVSRWDDVYFHGHIINSKTNWFIKLINDQPLFPFENESFKYNISRESILIISLLNVAIIFEYWMT